MSWVGTGSGGVEIDRLGLLMSKNLGCWQYLRMIATKLPSVWGMFERYGVVQDDSWVHRLSIPAAKSIVFNRSIAGGLASSISIHRSVQS